MDDVRTVCFMRDPAVYVGIGCGGAVYRFRDAVAVDVVGEGQRAPEFGHAHQLAALRPGIRPLAVRQQVTNFIASCINNVIPAISNHSNSILRPLSNVYITIPRQPTQDFNCNRILITRF